MAEPAAPVRVRFKHETTVDGQPYGPAGFEWSDEDPTALVPFDVYEQRKPQWMSLGEARLMAAAAGVPLEET
jgi:hypothetical protein